MGAVCGMVGGLMDSADNRATPEANTNAAANSFVLEDVIAWPSYYFWSGLHAEPVLVVVIADRFGIGDGFIAMDLDVGFAGAVDIGLTRGRRIHAEHRDELFQADALAGRARRHVGFKNQRLELLAAVQTFEIV
jgi:hypothetical protein